MTDNGRGIGTRDDRLWIYAQPALGPFSPETIHVPLSSDNLEQQGIRQRRAIRVGVINREGQHMLRLYVPAGITVSRRPSGQHSPAFDPPQTVAPRPVVSITTDR